MAANDFSLEELEALFNVEPQETPPEDNTKQPPAPTPADDDKSKKEITKGVAERIKAVKLETQDEAAKAMGFASYEDMLKSKEQDLIKSKGYDPSDLEPIVEELLKKRLENDPRIKELDVIKQERVIEYTKRELAEIARITDGEISRVDQIPKDVLDEWKKTGNLKSAFLLLKGEEYIAKAKTVKTENQKGGTDHLKSLGGGIAPPVVKTRPLNEREKLAWKMFNPQMSEEEINKKTTQII